jgi:CRISPR-associated protein Csc2
MENNQTLKSSDPLNEDEVIEAEENTIATLMQEEFIVDDDLPDNKFADLLNEVKAILSQAMRINLNSYLKKRMMRLKPMASYT